MGVGSLQGTSELDRTRKLEKADGHHTLSADGEMFIDIPCHRLV